MTYLAFHLVFVAPPLLLLAAGARRWWGALPPRAGAYLPLIALIALVYTTPWDNYLVWKGVWGYGPDRVLGTVGYVPLEEYLFFVLQPLLTGLWLYRVLARGQGTEAERSETARWAGALAYAAAAALGALLLREERGTYLGLILVWAAPVLALQWAYAGRGIWARRRAWLLGLAIPTLYLWVADALAIRLGIWHISPRFTLGPRLFGLPLEEAVFFLATNLLVVQGLLLFLFPPQRTAPARRARPARTAGTAGEVGG